MEKFKKLFRVVNEIARCKNCQYLIPSQGPFDGVCVNPSTQQYPKVLVFKDMSCSDFKENDNVEILLKEYHEQLFSSITIKRFA
jgi:hypothetical protein